jgi:hypothetical protein
VQSQRLWLEAATVIDTFEGAGIRTAVLKGAALFDAYGRDWGVRPMYDVDVLVPTHEAERALDLLVELGWWPEQGQTPTWVLRRGIPRRHGWGFVKGRGRLDLHWHVLLESIGAGADRQFWARTRPVELAGTRTRALDPADLVVHALIHGTVGFQAPEIQWVADSVMVLRHERADTTLAARVAETAHEQGEQRAVARALDAIGLLIDRELVADALAAVEAKRPTVADLLRSPRSPAALQQLGWHVAGGAGFGRAARELAARRLDLEFTTDRVAALTYAASLRSPRVATYWRDRKGSFVRTSVDARDVPALADGTALDFSDAAVLDRHGAIGWGRTWDLGADTRGGESRLVLPLARDLDDRGLELTAVFEARAAAADIVLFANEVEVARSHVEPTATEVKMRVPSEVAHRFAPLEVSVRPANRSSSPLRLRLRSLTVAATD